MTAVKHFSDDIELREKRGLQGTSTPLSSDVKKIIDMSMIIAIENTSSIKITVHNRTVSITIENWLVGMCC